jgi:hypothetical protein
MQNPAITFDPLSVLKVMGPDWQDSVTLAFTNNFSTPLNYTFSFPEPLDWVSLSGPVFSTLGPYGTDSIKIHFNSNGYPADTLFTYLNFYFGIDGIAKIPVHLFVDPDVGMEQHGGMEAWGHGSMELWPNPAREVLSVKVSGLSSGRDYSIDVFSISGYKVMEIKVNDASSEIRLNVEDLVPGIYSVLIKEGNKSIASGKFLINR